MAAQVSFDSDKLVLVDAQGTTIGHASKAACHDGEGLLHKAFSVFLFDASGRLLLQQRATDKRLWPGFWANSCCSHPRQGEVEALAVRRRVLEELGLDCSTEYIYRFIYHAIFDDSGAEWEDCAVYAGRLDATEIAHIQPHPQEIAALRWVEPNTLDGLVAVNDPSLSPWLKLEWRTLREEYGDILVGL